jgi:S-adenosylhomocysteine hydrolase
MRQVISQRRDRCRGPLEFTLRRAADKTNLEGRRPSVCVRCASEKLLVRQAYNLKFGLHRLLAHVRLPICNCFSAADRVASATRPFLAEGSSKTAE